MGVLGGRRAWASRERLTPLSMGSPARPEDAMDQAETSRSLGAVIKARRQELEWTQEELAERVIAHGDDAFRQSDVSRLERGKVGRPHRDRLAHIAAVLGLSPGELLARSGWAGADRAFAAAAPAMLSDQPEVAPVAPAPPAVPVTLLTAAPVDSPALPPREKSHRLREILAQAQATRDRSLQILARCEATRALYNLPPHHESRARARRAEGTPEGIPDRPCREPEVERRVATKLQKSAAPDERARLAIDRGLDGRRAPGRRRLRAQPPRGTDARHPF
jgi:transcriptional regulator with XRE-family HTH domain